MSPRAGRFLQAIARVRRFTDAETRRAAGAGARRRPALPADASRRLAERAARRHGAPERSDGICEEAALSPAREKRRRLWLERMTQTRGDLDRRRLFRKSRPGRLGRRPAFWRRARELFGGEADTTNNRMELMAAISALEALTRPCHVDLHTDSQYLRGRHHGVDPRLEEARLDDGRQEAREKHRAVASGSTRRARGTRSSGTG